VVVCSLDYVDGVMEKYCEKISDNWFAFVIWDESWKSYNNCYILIEANSVTLIDSGKEEHFQHLESSMEGIGINKDNITNFVATHGHKDHIGGIKFLEGIEGYIHHRDLELLPDEITGKLNPVLPDNGGTVSNLDCIHLGHHTKGSVALYHNKSKALFCGDHICFFGETLNGNSVVTEGTVNREKYKEFVSGWSQNEEMRKKYDFDLFMKGLKTINQFDTEYLCTGHGVVLKRDINKFSAELLEFERI
jgi:glyoxylase-like metal-dependent hydrolase (beta-lactamase superfamily II)